MQPVTDRRTRKREKTRGELLRAARELILEKGLDDFRVSDVTERSDIGLGSFYTYFAAKEDLIAAIVDETLGVIADAIGDLADRIDDPAEAMAVGALRLVGLCRSDPEIAELLVRLEASEPRFEAAVWARAERIMRRGAESGRFVTTDPALTLSILIAMVLTTIRSVVAGTAGDGADAVCATAALRAVGVPAVEVDDLVGRSYPLV